MLTTPPRVLVHDTWRTTQWAEDVTGDDLDGDSRTMRADDVRFWRFRVESDGDVQVARLLVAGPAVQAPGSAVVVQVGTHRPLFEVIDTPETMHGRTGTFTVTEALA